MFNMLGNRVPKKDDIKPIKRWCIVSIKTIVIFLQI